MSSVAKARMWIDEMVDAEAKREGVNAADAMRNLARRYSISFGEFWKLKYRPPKGVFVELYIKIAAAYAKECERQERKYASGRQSAESEILSLEAMAQSISAGNGAGRRLALQSLDMGRGQDQPG